MSLDASFESNGRSANLVEPGNVVDIVFTAPPPSASNVEVQIWEVAGTGDTVRTDRLICTFRGQITGGKFKLDGPSKDPLNMDPQANPEIASFARSNFPPTFKVRFKDDATESAIPLPDKEDENGAYDLKLKIAGVMGQAVLNVRIWQDVMIVPDSDAATAQQKTSADYQAVFVQNTKFGEQWRKFAGARRQVMKIKIDASLSEFESVVTAAAAKARGGDVLLFVGHAGVGGSRTTITAFDTTPSSVHGMTQHPNAINADVVNLPQIATKDGQGRWISKSGDQATVDKLSPRFDMLVRIGSVMKQGGVKRFILVSCNLGQDSNFGFSLANTMKMTVGAYRSFVATTLIDNSLVQIWLTDVVPGSGPDTSQPPFNDTSASSFHEIPGNLKEFQSTP